MNDFRDPEYEPVELPEAIRSLAGEYGAPPPTPKAELWDRIQAARRSPGRMPTEQPLTPALVVSARSGRRWMAWATGIAAILLAGIGLGRLSLGGSLEMGGSVEAVRGSSERSERAYATAAVYHLSKAETFLTSLRIDPTGGTQFTGQASDLLSSTRLLLDSQAGDNPKLRRLLEDLELILIQVVQLPEHPLDEELEFITDGLEQHNVIPRLRTAIPAGPIRM